MKKNRKHRLTNLIHRLVTAISVILIFVAILFLNAPKQLDIKAGDIAPEDVYAPREVVNEEETEKARQEARDNVDDIYVKDEKVGQTAVENINNLFTFAQTYRNSDEEASKKVSKLKENSVLEISDEIALTLFTATDVQFEEMKKISGIVNTEMQEDIKASALEESQKNCDAAVDKLNLYPNQKKAAKDIVSLVMTTNLVLDKDATDKAQKTAVDKVGDKLYRQGAKIVEKGTEVTQSQYNALYALGLVKGSNQVSGTYTFGLVLLLLVSYIIIAFFFSRNKEKAPAAMPITACCALIVILVTVYGSKIIPESMMELLPVGLFVGLVTIFSSAQTAIITNIILAVFCAVAFNGDWGYAICIIVAGIMSSYCFASVKRRAHLLPASIVSSVFYGLAFCALTLIESTSILNAFLAFLKGFGGGFLSGLITIGSLPLVEWLFNCTTPMKLSELANPENKLLKKLLVEAPGTYHHSLTVANISEIAARSIGADSLLTRVGAYYHDIGKLRHPLYFKENQYDKNAHDSLAPEESSQLIISHVSDGVEIAERNRLPRNIIDIIAEHHGTTTTGYFLIRAREKDPNVDASLFTYPGPAPRTKEAAIVMLADSCEAAVRSIEDKTESKIENMVRKIATERVNSGQFSHCNMTFEELETVIKVITKTLGGYFHERIKYE